MVDLFANWAALAAAETEGVDYRLPIRYNRSLTACIAIHGGAIEAGTSEVASGVAARSRHNYYSLEGIKSSGNSDLHITSNNYDEPKGIALVNSMDYCFSFHGMADQSAGVAETYVGGLDTVYRDAVISALQGAGFTASIGNTELDGTSSQNITNKTRRSMGVQLEMSLQQRKDFFPSGDTTRANRETGVRTETFYKYVKAVASVAIDLGGGANQTSQYRLNLAEPIDAMSDFETWINANWEKLRKATAPLSGTTLPQSGPYNLGDRFYKTDTKSIYILVCKSADWGWHWRPIHDAISPWLTVPITARADSLWTFNPVPANPFAIAFDNRGKAYWRGVIGVTSGTFARNTSHAVFKVIPDGLRPSRRGVYMLGHETLAVGTDGTNLAAWQGARVFVPNDPAASPSVRGFGGTADFNRVHLTGINYAVGTGIFYTP
jgi:phage replication-related protein YjqB (UPF0714/DUF867 family)